MRTLIDKLMGALSMGLSAFFILAAVATGFLVVAWCLLWALLSGLSN